MALMLVIGLVGPVTMAYAEEGEESHSVKVVVSRDTPPAATFSVDGGATFSVKFEVKNGNTTPGDTDRTNSGGYTLDYPGWSVSGPATSGTYSSLAGGSSIYYKWAFTAPPGPASGSITLTATVTSVDPPRTLSDPRPDTLSASASYSVTVNDTIPPPVPTLSAPVDGTVTNVNTVALAWSTVTDPSPPVSYRVEVSGPTPWSSGWLAVSQVTTPALSDGAYSWRVQARDSASPPNVSGWSAGNTFTCDTTPPNDPSNVQSPSHTPSVWSKDNTVDITWTDATDNLSGLDGYSILWDTSPNTIPPQTKNIEEGIQTTTSPALPDGSSHYFHIRSKDNAGNWGATVHLGPFFIRALAENFVTKTTNPGHDTVDNKGADTVVDKSGIGTPTVTTAKYSSNPGSGFGGDIGKYVDVYIDSDGDVDEIEIKLYYTDAEIAGLDESSLRLNWWNGSSWVACSDSGVNMAENYIWAKIRSKTTPNLNQLTGTPFGGEGSPLLLIPTLTWTGTIAMVALLGGLFGFMLRRRLVSRFEG